MPRRLVAALAALVLLVAGAIVFWFVTRPRTIAPEDIALLVPDVTHGEQVFWAAGCASCHMAEGAAGAAKLLLGGGQRFPTDFGTFVAPNISPDYEAGIGGWTAFDLANAMLHGTAPDKRQYYPVFPYPSYARADLQDIVDLHGYLMTLPAVATPSQPHEVGFPFAIRRLMGGWKVLFLDRDWVVTGDLTQAEERGRYLVEALGHCGECHTPRNAFGGSDTSRWLGGAAVPGSATARFPNITPGALTWSEDEIAAYLETGFTPEFDSAGGHMALVVESFAMLPADDRAAVAAYLKRVPSVDASPEDSAP
jgi:mono/diheme cytochrome c family protein